MSIFLYRLSHEIHEEVTICLGRLTGKLPELAETSTSSDDVLVSADISVDFTIACEGEILDGPIRSTLAPADPSGASWGAEAGAETLRFLFKVADLVPGCVLACELWAFTDTQGRRHVGSAVMGLFNKRGRLKTGHQRLRLHVGRFPDLRWPSATSGKAPASARGALPHLERKVKQLERGELGSCPWLDRKTLQAIGETEAQQGNLSGLYLSFQLPSFQTAVLYSQASMALPTADVRAMPAAPEATIPSDSFTAVPDPEVERATLGLGTNPCEDKALKISQASGALGIDRDAKPGKDDLAMLRAIVAMPPSKPLSIHQKTLLSKYRYFLAGQPNTIVPFLRSLSWDTSREVKIAMEAMSEWQVASVEEALQMLSASLMHPPVRAHAVHILREKADDGHLAAFLIQLVQCVRYDEADHPSSLADFLVERCAKKPGLAVALHWALIVDSEDAGMRERCDYMRSELYDLLPRSSPAAHEAVQGQFRFKSFLDKLSRAIAGAPNSHRAKEDALRAELEDPESDSHALAAGVPLPMDPGLAIDKIVRERCKVFKSIRSPTRLVFQTRRVARDPDGPPAPPRSQLVQIMYKEGDDLRQDQFVCQLIGIMDKVLKRENLDLRLTPYWVLPMSKASGILEFVPSVTLQDLTGKGKSEGVLRFLAENNPVGQQAASDVPAHRLRDAISHAAMENFIRSNAGYAIVSYLLDMGDRHQENILLTTDGRLFHIDFGYVLGMRDPKQWAKVPVPLKRELIAAMGGQTSEDYKTFRKLAVEAYIILRKHSSLFLTLLGCMAGSPIECFSADSAGVSLDFALSQMEERFKVDVSDDVARTHIFTLIDQSIANMLAPMGDTAHRIAANFRQ